MLLPKVRLDLHALTARLSILYIVATATTILVISGGCGRISENRYIDDLTAQMRIYEEAINQVHDISTQDRDDVRSLLAELNENPNPNVAPYIARYKRWVSTIDNSLIGMRNAHTKIRMLSPADDSRDYHAAILKSLQSGIEIAGAMRDLYQMTAKDLQERGTITDPAILTKSFEINDLYRNYRANRATVNRLAEEKNH